jgi:HlyD family secretion protein
VVDDKARTSLVVLDQQNGLEAQVLEGLNEGDQVVIHPSDTVQDGVAVRRR